MNRDRVRILTLVLAVAAGAVSFAVTRMSRPEADCCCQWLQGASESVAAMEANFNSEAASLDESLRAEQLLLGNVLDDPCSTGDEILERASRVSDAHAMLVKRAGEHVIAFRKVLPQDKCQCFMQFCGDTVCGNGRGGGCGQMGRGGGRGQGMGAGGRGQGMGVGRGHRGGCGFTYRLAMSEEQITSLAEEDPGYEADLQDIKEELLGARIELGEAIADGQISDEQLLLRLDEVLGLHGRLDRRVADHVVVMRGVLSVGQQKMLIGLCTSRRGQSRRVIISV